MDFDGGDIDVIAALTAVVEVASSPTTATGMATGDYGSVGRREGSFAGFVGDFQS